MSEQKKALAGASRGAHTDGESERESFEAWYSAVVVESQRRGFAAWFYRDRSAWREDYDNGETPIGAVQYNYECCF